MEPPPKKLLDRVRDVLRPKHYSIRTETAYVGWIRRFILFHGKRHPSEMGAAEVQAFLTHLAVEDNVDQRDIEIFGSPRADPVAGHGADPPGPRSSSAGESTASRGRFRWGRR